MSVRRPLFRKTHAFGVALLLALSARAQTIITFGPTVSPAWDSAANWAPFGLPGAGSLATIAGSTVGVNNAQSVGAISLALSNGITNNGGIGGGGTLTLTSTTFSSTWSGGSLIQGGTLKIGAGHTLALTGATDKVFAHGSQGFGGHTIQNQGTITWANGGNLLGGDGATFLNDSSGIFRANNNQDLGFNNSGDKPTFTNAGLFEKAAGTGFTTVTSFIFSNTGTVAAQTGRIQFAPSTSLTSDAGTFTANGGGLVEFLGTQAFNTGTQFLGTGLNWISGGSSTFTGLITANNLEFIAGNAYGTAAFNGSSVTWMGGNWLGTGTFAFLSGGMLTIEGAAPKTLAHGSQGFNGRVIGISGQAEWQDAGQIVMGDGAGFMVNAGGTFTIRNDATIGFNNSGVVPFFTNNGTLLKQTATGTTLFDRVELSNTGTLNLQTGTIAVTGSGALFNNSGTVNISTGAKLELGATGGTGGTSTGQYNLAFGGNVRLLGGTQTFNNGASVTGLGSFDILGGTLLVNGSATVGNIGLAPGELQLLAGTLGGSGTLAVKNGATFTWQGGLMNGEGTLVIESGGALDLISSTAKVFAHSTQGFNGRKIANFGTITWSGSGTLSGGDGAVITNALSGLFEVQTASTFGFNNSGNRPSFVNDGTFLKTINAGPFLFSGGTFTNNATGVVEVQAGTLTFAGGGASTGTLSTLSGALLVFSAPYAIDGGKILGSGEARIASTVTFSGSTDVGQASTFGALRLVAGGTLTGSGLVRVTGAGSGSSLDWNGGSMLGEGTTQILPGGTLFITGTGMRTLGHGSQGFNGRKIDNSGTILWLGSSVVEGGDGSVIANNAGGIFEVQGASQLASSNSGNAMIFNNAGTFKKSAGNNNFTYNGGAFNNTGLALVQSGSIRFGSGGTSTGGEFQALSNTTIEFTAPYTFTNGTTVTGGGELVLTNTTLTVGGSSASSISGTLELSANSAITGSGALEVANGGYLAWDGGSMLGDGTTRVLAGGELELFGVAAKTFSHGSQGFNGRKLENFGLMSLYDTGNLLLGDQASIDNKASATLALEGTAGIGHNTSGLQGSISNSGLFVKRNDNGTALVTNLSLTNQSTGTIAAQSGILEIGAAFANLGGTLNASGGAKIVFTGSKTFNSASFIGSGDIDVIAGTTLLGGTITSQNLNLAGGTVSGLASLFGSIEWSGGAIQGSSSLTIAAPSAVLNITGGADKTLSHGSAGFNGSILTNNGSIFWLGTGKLRLGDGAQIVNQLSFVAQNDALMEFNNSGNQPLFNNQGSFTKIASGGTTQIAVPFTNSGTVLVNSGLLRFSNSFTHTGGFITVSNNAIVAFDQGLNFTSGILAGVGSVQANVSNGGVISPGAPVGALTIDGNLTLLGSSTLLLELGGTVQGVGYDLLDVDGSVALGGALHVTFTNGFQSFVTSGNTFTVLVGISPLTGAFGNVANGQRVFTLDGAGSFQVNYGVGSAFASNLVVLSNFSPIPEPSTWALLLGGGAAVLIVARRRRA